MKIKILSDSTCDLSQELLDKYDIDIVPLIVMKSGEEFLDGVTITPADIFDHVAKGGELCSTAARSMVVYGEIFAKYVSEYDGIIHINIGSDFSSSYQNACLAAAEFDNVRVIDSASLCTGQGLVVLKACELAKTVSSLDEAVDALNEYKTHIEGSFVVDKLDYLAKGGRCSSATAMGANLLNLKICIELKDNHMSVGKKYRGNFSKCLLTYIKDRLEGREDIDTSIGMLTYTAGTSEEVIAGVREAIAQFGAFETLYESTAGCTISCHCGPSTLGIMFARK